MFHPRLIIHYKVWIIILIFCKLCLKKTVYIAVAAFSLGSSHNKQIKIIVLNKSVLKTYLRIVCFGHSCRDRALCRHLSLSDLFADISQCCIYLHTENFIQIGIGIRIHSKNRSLSLLAEILDQHSA